MTSSPGFWTSPDRFGVLGQAEYLDRIEHGVKGAGSLLERLLGSRPGTRERYPAELVGRLAQQLYLLEAACVGVRDGLPREAFVLLESGRDAQTEAAPAHDFARRLGGMYRAWAAKRRMQLQVLEESVGGARRPYRLLLAVSGYAAYPILRFEAGLHVLELPSGNGETLRRCKVRVRVVPQPDAPAGHDRDAARRQAQAALDAASPSKLAVVRRYRETPALVRDRVRGWRSGKLDRILAGDFDLVGGR
jgi:ATP-dependent Clp protease ATP-binding subunit ClpC